MAQRGNETKLNDQESDKCGQMKTILEKCNKILHKKSIESHLEDNYSDLKFMPGNDDLDETSSMPHPILCKNKEMLEKFIANLQSLKNTTESLDNLDMNEIRSDNNEQILQTNSIIKKHCEDIFTKIKNIQINVNNGCLDSKIMKDKTKMAIFLNRHEKLVERTCKIEKSIEALFNFDQDLLKEKMKDLKINNIDEFNKAANDLAQGFLNKVYEDGMKDFENHEHLLAIKKSNKLLTKTNVVPLTQLDPFTKQPITDPITNTICKHVYDQTSIDDIFKRKYFISCPYVGCKNKCFTKYELARN